MWRPNGRMIPGERDALVRRLRYRTSGPSRMTSGPCLIGHQMSELVA